MFLGRVSTAVLAAFLVSSCGGGGGGGSPPTSGPAPSPAPGIANLNVTLSAASADLTVEEGTTQSFNLTASYSGTSTAPIVADVKVGGTRIALAGSPVQSGNSFVVPLRTVPLAPGGVSADTITFRLCTAADCANVYPGSTKTFTANLDVRLKDWAMFQRNPAHTGYVAASYKPADFTSAWTWIPASGGGTAEMSATRGRVFVTEINSRTQTQVNALDSATGAVAWSRSLGPQSYASGPSYANGRVFVTSMVSSSGNNPQWVLDASDGRLVQQMAFAAQWSDFGQPTVIGNSVYLASGYFGNQVYNFDYTSGSLLWTKSGKGGNIWDAQSVAADDNYVYYYSGAFMDVFDRQSGATVRSIADPNFAWNGYSWDAAPVLDGSDRIFAFSSPRTYRTHSNLAGYSMSANKQIWVTTAGYTTAPAYANGKLFAGRNGLQLIDALDPATGKVDFSLGLPGNETVNSNIVVAGNLLFVSSTEKTYAFDLVQTGYPKVWETGAGGSWLAVSPDNQLLISDGKQLTAIKLVK